MTRPFKEYRTELKERQEEQRKKEEEKTAEARRLQIYIENLKRGQKVKFSHLVNIYTGEPLVEFGFFIDDTGGDYIWIASTRKGALSGYGSTTLKSNIII